jgi:succinate-acetate transporter protein
MGLLFTVGLTFLLLSIGAWANSIDCHQAGGAVGILASVIAWYCAMAGLFTKENSVFLLPVGDLNQRFVYHAPK